MLFVLILIFVHCVATILNLLIHLILSDLIIIFSIFLGLQIQMLFSNHHIIWTWIRSWQRGPNSSKTYFSSFTW